MKIDKKNILHWIILLFSGGLVLVSIIFRPLSRLRKKPLVVLYGHKLNGNLKAFYDFCHQEDDLSFELTYITIDSSYYKELKNQNVNILLANNPFHITKIAQAKAMITSHGYHTFFLYNLLTNMKFVDVRHGIPYKGYTAEDFKGKKKYDQEWLSSEWFKNLYIKEYGFREDQIKVTGFGRNDRLVLGDFNREEILSSYNLKDRKTVLLAPTWAQDDKGRSIVPFGLTMEELFNQLEDTGREAGVTIIFRAHLNSGDMLSTDKYEYIKVMPYTKYPEVEEFLFIADVLITDWSSIAIDYLALNRPTVFLDVPAPFSKDFTLGPEHRYGEIVSSIDELKLAIISYAISPESFQEEYGENARRTREVAHGETLDGKARDRYLENLKNLIH